jgi:hypothetical protein
VSPMRAESAIVLMPVGHVAAVIDPMAHERCDRCRAHAYVTTVHAGGLPLSWCAHHYAQHADALGRSAGVVIARDDRAQLAPSQRDGLASP